jgi:hypothetical protein
MKNNYLLWRAQLLPFLRSTKLIGYLDGTLPPPPKQVHASTSLDASTSLALIGGHITQTKTF